MNIERFQFIVIGTPSKKTVKLNLIKTMNIIDTLKNEIDTLKKTRHHALIREISQRNEAVTKDWQQSIINAIFHSNDDSPEWQGHFTKQEIRAEFQESLDFKRLIPDAYKVDIDKRTLTWWEIEVTHFLTPQKMQMLGMLKLELNEWNWTFDLRLVDRYGNDSRMHPVRIVFKDAHLLTEDGYHQFLTDLRICSPDRGTSVVASAYVPSAEDDWLPN